MYLSGLVEVEVDEVLLEELVVEVDELLLEELLDEDDVELGDDVDDWLELVLDLVLVVVGVVADCVLEDEDLLELDDEVFVVVVTGYVDK